MGGLEPGLAVRCRWVMSPGCPTCRETACRRRPVQTRGHTHSELWHESSRLSCALTEATRSVHRIQRQTPAWPGDVRPWRPVLLRRGQWLGPASRPRVCTVPGTEPAVGAVGLTGAFSGAALPPGPDSALRPHPGLFRARRRRAPTPSTTGSTSTSSCTSAITWSPSPRWAGPTPPTGMGSACWVSARTRLWPTQSPQHTGPPGDSARTGLCSAAPEPSASPRAALTG